MGKNYTVYIKDDRFDKEANKSGLLNGLLGSYYEKVALPMAEKEAEFASVGIRSEKNIAIRDNPDGSKTIVGTVTPNPEDVEDFKAHGTELECCEKAAPCRHWSWDENQVKWVNSLSGRTREDA